jgi:hypothetical protein
MDEWNWAHHELAAKHNQIESRAAESTLSPEMPAALFDHSATSGEAHVVTLAFITHKMALVQTVRCIRKRDTQVGHIRAVDSPICDSPAVV